MPVLPLTLLSDRHTNVLPQIWFCDIEVYVCTYVHACARSQNNTHSLVGLLSKSIQRQSHIAKSGNLEAFTDNQPINLHFFKAILAYTVRGSFHRSENGTRRAISPIQQGVVRRYNFFTLRENEKWCWCVKKEEKEEKGVLFLLHRNLFSHLSYRLPHPHPENWSLLSLPDSLYFFSTSPVTHVCVWWRWWPCTASGNQEGKKGVLECGKEESGKMFDAIE